MQASAGASPPPYPGLGVPDPAGGHDGLSLPGGRDAPQEQASRAPAEGRARAPVEAVAVVVLAAGSGKRLKSATPKVLHRAAGLPLINHVLAAAGNLENVDRTLVVVGNGASQVVKAVERSRPGVVFVEQARLLGTADAVKQCRNELRDFAGTVLVLAGDCPLITAGTLRRLILWHQSSGALVSLLTAVVTDPTGYGRILRSPGGLCEGIVEEPDASPEQKAIREVSSGIWCFERDALFEALEHTDNLNAQREHYLPQAAGIIAGRGSPVQTVAADDPDEILGVNDRLQLAGASRRLWDRKIAGLAASGVGIEDPATVYVDVGAEIAPGTLLRPLTFIEGTTRIGAGCTIGPSVRLVDSVVEDDVEVSFSVVRACHVGAGATVGPFASMRPGSRLGPGGKIGTFVETKESTIGEGSKVPHLSYVGDAEIGKDVNLGAGTITGNYDTESKVKSRTVIQDGAFTGSDTTLVAPVRLGRSSGTGAGSVVTKDVEDGQIVAGVPARPFRKRRLEQQ